MPNTPALVDAAATAISGGEHASESDLAEAK
jgi:pyrroline-5-carboxylate reductase